MFKPNSIKTDVVTITPERATELLAKNTSNRRIAKRNLSLIKEAMIAGEWELNGEAIKIAQDGTILDGQHRLMASVETGTTFQSLIVTGLKNDVQQTMDTGKSRTIADVLTLRGYKRTSLLAAITTSIIRWEKYHLKAAISTGDYPVTAAQAVARIESEPGLQELVREVSGLTKIGISGRMAGLLYYVFSSIDAEDAQHFMSHLESGEGLERGNPILTLRNLLLALKSDRSTKSQIYVGAVCIKAWNKFRDGDECLTLRFTPGGANPERFPEPR